MTVIETARFLLKKYTSGGDPHPSRVEFNSMMDTVDNNAAMYAQGIATAKPAAGKPGRFFWDETNERLNYDTGAAWKDANPNGGGGGGRKVTPGVDGIEGTSARAARADHTHRLDLATSAAAGAMPAADKALLDTATTAATANALVKRDAGGRISANTPTDPAHVVTKAYADGQLVQAADYADALLAAGPEAGVHSPLLIAGYSIEGYIYTEPVGGYRRVTVDLSVMRTGGAQPVPGGSTADFISIGNVIPLAARGSGMTKYLPVSLSGGATNVHATISFSPNGSLQIKGVTAFTWNNNALFSIVTSYMVPAA